jgi:hypothetical protein
MLRDWGSVLDLFDRMREITGRECGFSWSDALAAAERAWVPPVVKEMYWRSRMIPGELVPVEMYRVIAGFLDVQTHYRMAQTCVALRIPPIPNALVWRERVRSATERWLLVRVLCELEPLGFFHWPGVTYCLTVGSPVGRSAIRMKWTHAGHSKARMLQLVFENVGPTFKVSIRSWFNVRTLNSVLYCYMKELALPGIWDDCKRIVGDSARWTTGPRKSTLESWRRL